MSIVLLHDLDGEEVLINVGNVNGAVRRFPDENAVVKDPFTKLFFATKDKGMEALGFPDSVKESPGEIFALVEKSKK